MLKFLSGLFVGAMIIGAFASDAKDTSASDRPCVIRLVSGSTLLNAKLKNIRIEWPEGSENITVQNVEFSNSP